MIGLRAHLVAQDCILDFTGDVEHNRASGLNTLAVFLGVDSALDRVSTSTAITRWRQLTDSLAAGCR